MKRRYVLCGAVLVACAIFLALAAGRPKMERLESEIRRAVAEAAQSGSGEPCPVDFAALQKRNGDIYGWLFLPDAGISEPLLQREGDGVFYMTHNSAGETAEGGALFTESGYNGRDLSDPATVIYGKNTEPGRLFGSLQAAFSQADAVERGSEVIVYLPGETVRYTVFAAMPFGSYHLLYYFNFSSEKRFQAFLDAASSVRTLDAHWNSHVEVTPADRLLILSTVRSGSPNESYLVLAKRME